jgi:hypothetical protein
MSTECYSYSLIIVPATDIMGYDGRSRIYVPVI